MLTKPPALTEGPNGLIETSKLPRVVVQRVFEAIGGEELMAAEAVKDPKWFIEKIYGKIVQPEKIMVEREKSVAELLIELDSKMVNVTPTVEILDADFDPQ